MVFPPTRDTYEALVNEVKTLKEEIRNLRNEKKEIAGSVLDDKVESKPEKLAFDLIAGTHIVLDHPAPKAMYYVEAPQDGRAVFVIPWKGQTMIGTTETKYQGDPSLVNRFKRRLNTYRM